MTKHSVLFVLSFFIIIQPVGTPAESEFFLDAEYPEDVIPEEISVYPSDLYIAIIDGRYYLYSAGVQIGEISEEDLENEPFASLPIIGG